MSQVLDASVTAAENAAGERGYVIHEGKVIDLSKIDVEDVRKAIKEFQTGGNNESSTTIK